MAECWNRWPGVADVPVPLDFPIVEIDFSTWMLPS